MSKVKKYSRTNGYLKHPAYKCYAGAKDRCTNTNCPAYKYYGGRGIKFKFNSFPEFVAEVGERPSMRHTLDRIDNNGHYEKGNIRWATQKQQARNGRHNRIIKVNGKSKTVAEWAETTKVKRARIHSRLVRGWCEDCAVLLPKRVVCPHKPNKYCRGSKVTGSKLTATQVKFARALREKGKTYTYIGELFGVSHKTISALCRRKTWKHI